MASTQNNLGFGYGETKHACKRRLDKRGTFMHSAWLTPNPFILYAWMAGCKSSALMIDKRLMHGLFN